MLVLSRKAGQSFLIGNDVEITVLEISGDKAKIAINAPKDVQILRKELAETKEANVESAASDFNPAVFSGLKRVLETKKNPPQDR